MSALNLAQGTPCYTPGRPPGYIKIRKLLETLRSQQLELDFTPRRQRWANLEDCREDTRTWPDWLIDKVHHVLLRDTQDSLRMAMRHPDRVSQEGFLDRVSWIAERSNRAFSFNACCYLEGIRDPEEVREQILRRCRSRLAAGQGRVQ